MKYVSTFGLLVVCALAWGCVTHRATGQWGQKASAIPVGTPKDKVEEILPPVGAVLDLRSGPGAGPVAYWVDDTTSVKLRYDTNENLAEPVMVEFKRRPEANK